MTFMASSSPPFGGAAAIQTLSCVLPRLRGSTLGGAFSSRVKLAFGFAIPMRHDLCFRKTALLFSCFGVNPVHSKLAYTGLHFARAAREARRPTVSYSRQ